MGTNLEDYLVSRGVGKQAAKTSCYVLNKSLFYKPDRFGFYHIPSKVFTAKGCYHYRKAIVEGLIDCDGLYSPSSKAYGYCPSSILMDLLYDYHPNWSNSSPWEPNHVVYPSKLMRSATKELAGSLTRQQVNVLEDMAEHARQYKSDSYIRWWCAFTQNSIETINYKYSATGRIYTPLQTMPKLVAGLQTRPLLFPGCWDFDLTSSHTQAICAITGLEFKEDWLPSIQSSKEDYLKALGSYKRTSDSRWPFLQTFKKYFMAMDKPLSNACGLLTPIINEHPSTVNAKLHAFFCQGWEAASIHELTLREVANGNTPMVNYHDGIILKQPATNLPAGVLYKQVQFMEQ